MLHQLMAYQAAMLADPQKPDTSPGRWRSRRALVREAEQLMDQHEDGSLTMFDLCEQLVVSERSLHYAFEEICGQTPMTWYRMKRLNAVRRTLKHADPGCTSISKIAKAAGFHHTGAFAAAYHSLFGELPSETLG
jgi:AraC family ethanolamine operon transcriptional activator